jgi:hypothetical protein
MSTALGRRLVRLRSNIPIISFTFDDFPRSAALLGADILLGCGFRATYYVSLGLRGSMLPAGKAFVSEDLHRLCSEGHELGCHTFHHYDAWKTPLDTFANSVAENARALRIELPQVEFKTHSYPLAHPHPLTKRRIGHRFACCRAGGKMFNSGLIDANGVEAIFLEKNLNRSEALKRLIDQNARAKGWLIFATHDVCADPSPFGCDPEFFAEIVEYVSDSKTEVLPVCEAWEALTSGI